MKPRAAFSLLKDSVEAWQADYASSMGASIAFYTVFSIAPLLIIVIAVAGFIWGQDAVHGSIMRELSGLVGEEAAEGVQALLRGARNPTHGIISTIVSVAVLMFGATRVFAELQRSLDRIWKVEKDHGATGIWHTIRSRALSFGLVLALAFLLLVSMVLSTALAAIGQWTRGLFPGWEVVMQGLNGLVSFGITVLLFAMIYKLLPRARIAWSDVWTGAIFTSLLFEIGKLLIGLYLGKSSTVSSLTAAGSFIVVLLWVYYAAQIFLLGAEFTRCYAHKHGSGRNRPPLPDG